MDRDFVPLIAFAAVTTDDIIADQGLLATSCSLSANESSSQLNLNRLIEFGCRRGMRIHDYGRESGNLKKETRRWKNDAFAYESLRRVPF